MDKHVVLVTGANRGIGLEVVRQLAHKGHTVILTSRKPDDGAKAMESIGNLDVLYHPLDVTDATSVDSIQTYIKTQFNRLDALINNAGINYDSWQKAETADLGNVRETFETNFFGVWRMCMAFIPMMKQHQFGRIVNVSSGAGALEGMAGGTPGYGTSKAALNALTIKLAKELHEHKILVNAVCPGWVRTKMGGTQAPRSVEQGAKGIVWAAELPDDGPTGGFFRDGKKISF